ncbi:RNA recognition motif domain [Macleaya cordata]|uniref:RNA recognition motif domain n=1 Tax=Macleaya cordata TaxID=56857 RepID=A0A200QG55_MACCD|nr:RNA recognition motif domain [Macleaya cordata]OVA09426.1 RNA recognition motif domain [Macleaya cordata]
MDSEQGKIFVGGISWETNEDTLKDHFNKFGEVVETVIMRDRNTGSARGFGFVLFSDPSVADKALQEKHVILGRTVEVKKAVPRGEQHQQHHPHQHQNKGSNKNSSNGGGNNNHFRTKKIFVGGLAATLTEEEFKAYFEKFGRITDVVVMYDSATHRPRGFGFITFDSEEAVENVMQKSFHELNDKVVEVKRAVPKDGSNNGNNGGFNMRMGGGRGSLFGSFQGGLYPPYSPRYGIYSGYAPPHLSGYATAGAYPYGAGGYTGGYPMGSYGAYGMAPIVASRSPWNGSTMVSSRRSPVPYAGAAIYPGYMNGVVGMAGGGYRGIMGPAGNGKWNQGGGGDAQMPGTTSPSVDGGKLDDDSSGHTVSYGAVAVKHNPRGSDGRVRSHPVGNSS